MTQSADGRPLADVCVQDDMTGGNGPVASKLVSAATTNATSVKASKGRLYAIHALNTNASARYLKFYNKASAPTVGTDVPVLTLPLVQNVPFTWTPHLGILFSLGIALAITGASADNDATNVGAGDVILNIATA